MLMDGRASYVKWILSTSSMVNAGGDGMSMVVADRCCCLFYIAATILFFTTTTYSQI